jgi:hypothetical protein
MTVYSPSARDGGADKRAIFMPSERISISIDFSLMGAMRVYSENEIM